MERYLDSIASSSDTWLLVAHSRVILKKLKMFHHFGQSYQKDCQIQIYYSLHCQIAALSIFHTAVYTMERPCKNDLEIYSMSMLQILLKPVQKQAEGERSTEIQKGSDRKEVAMKASAQKKKLGRKHNFFVAMLQANHYSPPCSHIASFMICLSDFKLVLQCSLTETEKNDPKNL